MIILAKVCEWIVDRERVMAEIWLTMADSNHGAVVLIFVLV